MSDTSTRPLTLNISPAQMQIYLTITPKARGLEHEQSERPRKIRKLLGQETFAFFDLFRAIRVPNVIAFEKTICAGYGFALLVIRSSW